MDSARLTFVTLEPAPVMSEIIHAVVGVLRPQIRQAWIDAVSDLPWPEERVEDVAALLDLEKAELESGRRRKRTGMGINLDLSNEDQFRLLVRLAPYSINAEAWSPSREVFSAHDTGDHAWFSLSPGEATQAAEQLALAGLRFEDVLSFRG